MKKKMVLFLSALLFAAYGAEAKVELNSPGVEAFQAKQYNEAIRLFERQLTDDPNNVFLLNYIAQAQIKSGNPVRAIVYLEKARLIEPNNLSIRYHLGNAYYLSGDRKKAQSELVALIENSPDTFYASRAKSLLARVERTPRKKKLRGYLRQSYQYDSNTILEPQKAGIPGVDKDSSRFVTRLWMQYLALQEEIWSAGLTGSAYQSFHTEEDSERVNLSSFRFGPYAELKTDFFEHDFTHHFEYNYLYDILNGDTFVRAHRLHYRAWHYPLQTLKMIYLAQVDINDYAFRGARAGEELFNRDSVTTTIGIRAKILLPKKQWLYMGYDYENNDAEGTNWNYDKNRFFTEFATPFFTEQLYLFLLSEYYLRLFSPFDETFYGSGSERKEHYYSFRVKMRYAINDNSALETSYRYTKTESRLERFFEYERQIFDVSYVLYF